MKLNFLICNAKIKYAFIKEINNDELDSYLHITEDIQEFETQIANFQKAILQADIDGELKENVATLPIKADNNNEIELQADFYEAKESVAIKFR